MTEVRVSGPIFDGRAPAAARAYCDELEEEVGLQAYAEVMTNLNRSIRNPTPYYETQVISQRRGDDVVVHDRGVIYGPWLEGTGSRNRTTRFKGYFSFRRAAQTVRGKVDPLAQSVLRRFIGRMQ